ncbi:MAG: ABC transporter ATP-binding protein [Actinobacteria bacterium]|nr:ABC transporter ATP-binding protein [Actinomycetota bacterium]
MTLTARLDVDLGRFALRDVTITVADGETVALLGPNGAGKTTALRAVMGLVDLDEGRVVLDDTVLDDRADGTWVPPEQRRIGAVFQHGLLFPHLTVLENVAFGPRSRGVGTKQARQAAHCWLEELDVAELARERPRSLSGGQAQRVALARALATEPRLLVLDEPLTALDASTRPEVRRALAKHLDAFDGSALVVAHDPIEAMALADRIIVIEDGGVTQEGTPTEVREQPKTRYVADVAGVNLYRGEASANGLRLANGEVIMSTEHLDGPAFAVVHPKAVALHANQPAGTPRNVWQGIVCHVDPEGDRSRVHVDAPVPITAEITAVARAELALAEGSDVWVSVKAAEVTLFPA